MINTTCKENLQIEDLEKIFKSGEKQSTKIGLEYERIPVRNDNGKHVDYFYENGILNFLQQFAKKENWDFILDKTNGQIIGLKNMHDTITLEPGCQIELSIEPENSVAEISKKVNFLDDCLNKYLIENNIKLLDYGISPLSTYQNINLIPKRRYHLMAKYLWGILSDVMMRETAGIQCCIDFKNEEDMAEKFNLANKISPFMTAMFANSPIRGGVDTGYKSFRALSWLNCDNDRCGFANNLENDFSYKKYIDTVINSPMIFITRNDIHIPINGKINFQEFMKYGYEDYKATIEDFELHANLYFPEVRLRNFIEIRNHDCVNKDLMLSILAIYKGIMYNKSARNDISILLDKFSISDIEDLRYSVAKTALNTKIKKYKVSDIAKEILKISEKSLVENKTGEEQYLTAIKKYTFNNLCPADIILKNWNGCWKKSINKLVENC